MEKTASNTRTQLEKFGTGKNARVKVMLRDKTEVEGYLTEVGEEHFVVSDKAGRATEVAYSKVEKARGNNPSTGEKLAIGTGLAAAVKRNKIPITLCARFLWLPIGTISLLWLIGLLLASPAGTFWVKVGLTLAGAGLGSVVPYLSSEEALYFKFASVEVVDGKYHLIFDGEDKETFDLVKVVVGAFFFCGVVIWLGNIFSAERFSQPEYPEIFRWFWVTGILYFGAALALFVYLSLGRKTTFVYRKEAG
ncbi:MAG TPA: hypothetical protein VJ866_23050 [Pyrinomonadaceae bacterium]|nr:hypothetical protein [Pyrinomonadaceae bacterium]